MRTSLLSLALVGALIGCNSQPSTRAVTGQLRVDMSTMNHPVVIAQSSDHRVFVASVTGTGRFTLQLPPNVSYRLTLASTTRSGAYSASARINWPLASGSSRWAALGGGATLDLGNVYRRGTRPSGLGTSCDSCGGGSDDDGDDDHGSGDDDHGDCHEDDNACQSHDNEVDDDCDHQATSGDQCDKDDDADQHDHDADDDDGNKCNADGGASGGGTGTGGGGGTGTGGGGIP